MLLNRFSLCFKRSRKRQRETKFTSHILNTQNSSCRNMFRSLFCLHFFFSYFCFSSVTFYQVFVQLVVRTSRIFINETISENSFMAKIKQTLHLYDKWVIGSSAERTENAYALDVENCVAIWCGALDVYKQNTFKTDFPAQWKIESRRSMTHRCQKSEWKRRERIVKFSSQFFLENVKIVTDDAPAGRAM